MWIIYKSIAKFLLMDLELSAQISTLPCLFTPIEQFSSSVLYQQPIQLENSFSISANNMQPHFLLTLIGNTLLYSPLSEQRLEPTGGLMFSFDLKFQVIYQVERNVRSPKRGLRLFLDQTKSMSLFATPAVIEAWNICLSQQLNQLGFHEMFKPLKKLGKGNFASVYEVERLTDGRRFAVKAFSKQNCFSAKNGKQSLINELSIMRALSSETHNNLLKLECVFESENSIYVVLELITGGQLFHRIQERNGYFTEQEVKEFMLGLLRGLKRMHEERIMHRDLKPQNIMMRGGASMSPIIVDYGLATHADVQKYLFFRCGTPGYVAPEIIELTESRHIEPQCDIFSAGVIFHILLTRRPLFQGSKYDEVYRKNKEMKFSLTGEAYKDIDPAAIDLLKSMLLGNPKDRVTASSALSHAYFSNLNSISQEKVSSPVATCASTRRRIFN